MKFVIVLVLAAMMINQSYCDLPVHCLAKNIEGVWLLHMTNNNGDNSLKCGHDHPDKNLDHLSENIPSFFVESSQLLIGLERPNIVYPIYKKNGSSDSIIDSFQETIKSKIGSWTMVYDEGFELKFSNYIFFTFSKYRQKSSFKATNTDTEDTPGYESLCDKTFVGWFHKDDGSNWGCFWAEKISSKSLTNYVDDKKKVSKKEFDYSNIFSYNEDFNEKYNTEKSINSSGKSKSLKIKEIKKENSNQNVEKDQSILGYSDFLTKLYSDDSNNKIPNLDIYLMKPNSEFSNKSSFMEEQISIGDKKFEPDYEFVNRVNNPSNKFKWKAAIYDDFKGKPYSSMRSLLGNVNSFFPGVSENDLGSNFIELEISMTSKTKSNNKMKQNKEDLPSSFNWSNIDGINFDSPVKKQGECGSCYTLALLSTFESRLRIKSNNRIKVNLSSSNVLGCSRTNQGCSGGYPFLVGKHGAEFGFVEESCQPYEEDDKTCKSLCYEEKTYKAKSYGYVGGYDGACNEEEMMHEIYKNGPIVVAINATPELYYYKSGIFHSSTTKKEGESEKNMRAWEYTNHAVVVIGWGEEYIDDKLEKFWILKNSWGDSWGEKGYFRLSRGVNMASVEAQAVYVNPE